MSERFWETCVRQIVKKVNSDFPLNDARMKKIGSLYEQAGGLWYSLAAGDSEAWTLLRKVCQMYIKSKRKDEK